MNAELLNRFSFGDFELDAAHRLLLRKGEAINLNSKTLDLLLTLVQNQGAVLSKNDLLDRVWENQFVEENNLTVHVAALRKALGERKNEHRYIVTVPGKGYSFVAEVNAPANGGILVESHKIERIIVEQTIEDTPGARPSNGFLAGAAISARRWTVVLATAVLLALGTGMYWLRSKEVAANSANASLEARVFPTNGGVPHRVVLSPDGKTLAYVQRFRGQDTIWLGDVETMQSFPITKASDRLHESITFHPDGKNLYFTARDASHPQWTLMSVSTFGGAVRELVVGVHGNPTFSPDGRRMAFFRRDGTTHRNLLAIAEAETGKQEQPLLRLEGPQKFTSLAPAWSRDGKAIAVGLSDESGKGCRLATVDATNAATEQIGETICRNQSSLVWLNDGSGLVMISGSDDGGGQIFHVSFPGGESRKITNDTLHYSTYALSIAADDRLAVLLARSDPKIWVADVAAESDPRPALEGSRLRSEGMQGLNLAPDGKILYTARTGDSRSLWEMEADGTAQRQLTPTTADRQDTQVVTTSDNRFLVFESDRSGKSEIWRAGRDGSHMTQLTDGGGNSSPAVTPDARSVVHASTRDGKTNLWNISIDGGTPRQLTTDETAWPDVSPDGKFIACSFGNSADAEKNFAIFPIEGGQSVHRYRVATNGVLYNRLRFSADGRSVLYKDIVQGLWRQDLAKDSPEMVKGLEDVRVFHFAHARDGSLAYSGGIPMREIVLLESFR